MRILIVSRGLKKVQHCRETGAVSFSTREVQQFGPYALRAHPVLADAIAELTKAHRVRLVVDGKRREIKINPALLKVH